VTVVPRRLRAFFKLAKLDNRDYWIRNNLGSRTVPSAGTRSPQKHSEPQPGFRRRTSMLILNWGRLKCCGTSSERNRFLPCRHSPCSLVGACAFRLMDACGWRLARGVPHVLATAEYAVKKEDGRCERECRSTLALASTGKQGCIPHWEQRRQLRQTAMQFLKREFAALLVQARKPGRVSQRSQKTGLAGLIDDRSFDSLRDPKSA